MNAGSAALQNLYYMFDDFTDPWIAADTVWIQHGVGRHGGFFRHWVPPLARRFRIIRPDLRGHGQSFDPGPAYRWSADDLLSDMLRLMDALHVEKMHFIGESAGGVLGLSLAARHPDRFLSVTALSSPLAIPHANLNQLVKATGHASMEEALRSLSLADWTRAQFESGGLTALDPAHAEWVVGQWSRNKVANLWGIMSVLPGLDLAAMLPSIKVPVLLLAPTRSPLTGVAQQKQMAAMIPAARAEAIDGRAHEIYVDKSDACIAAFTRFVDSL